MKREQNDLKKRTGAEMRADAASRAAQQADPNFVAKQHEEAFLKNLAGAQDHYEWIVANEAWVQLGYETHTSWYMERVRPLVLALGARPSPEVSASIIDHVQEDEAHLPPAQRMTQRELADVAGVSTKTLQRRSQDRSGATMSPGGDLADSTVIDPVSLIPGVEDAVNEFFNNQTPSGGVPEEGAPVSGAPAGSAGETAAGGSSTPADPEVNASSDSDTSGSAAGVGASADRPAPAAPEDHRDATGDEDDDEGSSSDAQPPADDTALGDETDPEVFPQDSGAVDGREQAPPGASGSALDPDAFEKFLDEQVPNADPHQKWRATFLRAIRQSHALAAFPVGDVASLGNNMCFDALVNLKDFVDGYLTAVQKQRLELQKQEAANLPANVTPIRRTA